MTRDADAGRASARRGLLFVLLAAFLWGTSGVVTKTIYSLASVSPITVAAARLALGAPILLAAYRLMHGSGSLQIHRRDLALLLLAGATLGVSQACYFAAVAELGVAIATLVTICTAPVLVSLASSALLRERVTLSVAIALVSALAGTVLLIGLDQVEGGLQGAAALRGILFALGAAACFATFILASRRLAYRYHPLWSVTIAVGIGAGLLLALMAATAGVSLSYPLPVWALFLYLGLAPTALGYAFFYQGVQHTTASEAAIASQLEPLTGTLLAVLFFGERLGTLGVLGAALLIGAIAFLYWNGSGRTET